MGKVALVTGSSRGIGASIVYELARIGYDVIINYNNSYNEALELENEIKNKFGVKTLLVKCDISKEDEVKEMVNKIMSTFNKIDVLVNNAGIAIDTAFEDKTYENFRKTIDTNLIGTFLVSRLVGDIMYQNNSGKIVNIASTNGIETYYEESLDYDASKAGVISLTHNLAKHYAPYINVNAVAPGWVDTDMNKELDKEFVNEECKKIYLKRFATSIEIAKVVAFLVSDDASYINNSIIRVDGGCDYA